MEFTELQGVMGKEYAMIDGEGEDVAEALTEQYQPRFAGDELPQTDMGKVLGLADKFDTITGMFSRGFIPTLPGPLRAAPSDYRRPEHPHGCRLEPELHEVFAFVLDLLQVG